MASSGGIQYYKTANSTATQCSFHEKSFPAFLELAILTQKSKSQQPTHDAFNGYMFTKEFVTIFDALAVHHWARSELTGFTKPDAMVTALQATDAQFASIQGVNIWERSRGTFLYSREHRLLLSSYNAPHLLSVDITRRVSTRRRLKVELTLHDDDVPTHNANRGHEGQDESRNDEEEETNTRNQRYERREQRREERNRETEEGDREPSSPNPNPNENDADMDGNNSTNEARDPEHGNDFANDNDRNRGDEAREAANESSSPETADDEQRSNVRGAYDNMPTADEVLNLANGSSMPGAREKASSDEIMTDPFAVIDHISLETCCGQKNNFHEAKHVSARFRQNWARVCATVFRELSETANAIHHQQELEAEFEIRLECHIKMFFLIPTLIFRKVKGRNNLNSNISLRLNQWNNSQWIDLIADFEKDIVEVHGQTRNTTPTRPKSVKEFNIRRGIELIASGQMSRGSKALLSKGVSSASNDDAIKAQMEAKFLKRKKDIKQPTDAQWEHTRASLDRDIFRSCILKLRGQVSPGLTGFRNEYIQALLFSEQSNADFLAKSAFDELYAVANDIVQGRLPWYFYQAWNGTSLTALNKKSVEELAEGETMDCRPVCKGDSLRKVITKALYAPFMERIQAVCDPCQFGVGTKGGGAQLTMALCLLMEANPNWVCIALDIKNAFNEIMRQEVLDALWDDPELRPLWYYNFRNKVIHGFVGLGYGPQMAKALFAAIEGEKQGDAEAMQNFCLGINRINKLTLASLREKGGWLLAGADDTYILGPPEIVFPEVKHHEDRLRTIGLELSYPKMKCYIAEEHRNDAYHQARHAIGHCRLRQWEYPVCLKAYGVPIGTNEYISHWLNQKSRKIISNLQEISDLLDPNAIVPAEIPTRQCLWLLTLICLQFKGNYFIRHIPPQFTELFSDRIDTEVNKLVSKCFHIDFANLSNFVKTRIHLPIKLGGIGIRQLSTLRWNEYMGGIMEGVVPLLDKQTDDGFLKGKLEAEHIEHWIGRRALNAEDGPWHKLLSHGPRSPVGAGISQAFDNFVNTFNSNLDFDTENKLNSELFHNIPALAGFTADGIIKSGSITKRLTSEIEKGIKLSLVAKFKQNVHTDYKHNMERLAWFNHDEISQQFLRALPNHEGLMSNKVFMEAVRNYLGLPSFILKGFADGNHFIGRNKAPVDPYGIAVKNAMLLQGDYICIHGTIQSLIMDMLKKAKVWAIREPQHLFHGHVSREYLRQYCEQQRTTKDFIIPDIMTHDHPMKQRNGRYVRQSRIFEIKTMRVDSRQTIYCPGNPQTRAVEKRVKSSSASYLNRCKHLDEKIAPGDTSRPFTTAYQSYRDGGVDHLVVGNFGEVNKGFKKFIAETAILAGGQCDAANMTPANWTDVGKKDAVRLMKKRFKVAIGCAAVRLQSDLLIRRIQFIRSTRNAAYAAACAGPPRGYFHEYGNSWFNNRENDDAYHMFRSYNNEYFRYDDDDGDFEF